LCVSGRLLNPEEALEVGFVDELVAVDGVVTAALRWCEQVIEAPERALAETRSVLRRDLMASIRDQSRHDVSRLVDQWFQPELQAAMRGLVARLKGL
jgi:enoyl-CoA hydratase/carnithine racemase